MRNQRRVIQIILIIVMVTLVSGCFTVRIIRNVKNPDHYFDRAYEKIDRVHRRHPNREGRSRRINVLAYKTTDCELIKISTPFWFVNTCMDIGIKDSDVEAFDMDDRYDIDWRDIKELEQVGPGLLVEIDDEQSKVLIWLE